MCWKHILKSFILQASCAEGGTTYFICRVAKDLVPPSGWKNLFRYVIMSRRPSEWLNSRVPWAKVKKSTNIARTCYSEALILGLRLAASLIQLVTP